MKRFHNILYVSHGVHDESDGLKQALSLARTNAAALRVLVVYPEFPKSHREYLSIYEDALAQRIQQFIRDTQQTLQLPAEAVPVDVRGGRALSAGILQEVQQHRHDLIIKQAEARSDGEGLMSVDMELLRQCPVPVWLSRPIKRPHEEIRVAVAIDAENDSLDERRMAVDLLQLSRSLADSCSGKLRVISCWDYEFESFLRGSAWSKVPEEELNGIVRDVETGNRAALEALIKEAGVAGDIDIMHLRGKPAEIIPRQVTDSQVDILVMGTLARSGIAGDVMGNTAENVVQGVHCSLLALKPEDFAKN